MNELDEDEGLKALKELLEGSDNEIWTSSIELWSREPTKGEKNG